MKPTRSSSYGLRKQLMVLIFLIFVPVLFILLFTGYKQYNLTLKSIENDIERLIRLFSEEQLNITSKTYQLLDILSHVPAVYNLDLPRCNDFLKMIHQNNSQYSTIVVANSDGIIDCCAIPLKKSIDVTDRSWFKRIKQNRVFIVDHFLISRSAKKASLPFAYPILDSEGNLKAAVGAAFDIATYNQLFDRIPLPQDSVIILTDRESNLLYASVSPDECLGQPILDCRGFKIPENEKGRFEVTDIDGKNRIYWFKWLWVGQKSNQICLFVGISKKNLFKNIKDTFLINIAALAVVALFSLATAWFLGKKNILTPISFLVDKTNRIKQGHLSPSAENERHLPTELYILSQAFDEMVSDLSQREKERDQALIDVQKELSVREKTEKELREREERLRILFEQAADAIYVCKLDGRLVKVNQEACRVTGYTEQELLNLNVIDIDVKDTQKSLDNFFKTLLPGKPVSISSVHRRKSGTTFPVEITIALLETPDGSHVMGIARDVTERKAMEERIKQAQKMESIGNLSGGIAHDFNNILSPIIGISEMLMDDIPPDSSAYGHLQQIYQAGIRGANLTRQILAFSRQSEQKKSPVKFQLVLNEVLDLCRSTIPINIKILHDISPNCGLILADPTQLHQIVMNLITNAYHALNNNGGCISVMLKETVIHKNDPMFYIEPGRYAMLTVSDTGVGIHPDIIGKIFDPYFTTKEKGRGTGLGLATVYGIVKDHGGDIKVYSEVGKGTVFSVYLPMMAEADDDGSQRNTQLLPTGNERILIVDDEEAIAVLEKQILERLGYRVIEQTSSIRALNTFKMNPDAFDLVITDMTMPEMTGDQLAKEIISIKPEIPIIICTGFSERINKEKAEAIGVKGLLMKPVLKSDIAKMVRRALDGKSLS